MDASSALRLDTKHVKIRLRRARCHVATNNYDQAVRDFEMALGDMKASGASPAEMAEVASELQEAKEKKAERFGPKPAEHHSSKPSASSSSRQSGYTYSGSNGGSSVPPPPPPHQGKPAAPAAHEVDAEFPNHYAVLGVVEFTATAVEIKKAYHKLALRYHPDKISLRRCVCVLLFVSVYRILKAALLLLSARKAPRLTLAKLRRFSSVSPLRMRR